MTPTFFRGDRVYPLALILTLALCSITTPASALPITDYFILRGLVNNPGTFKLTDLESFPPTTQPASYKPGSFTGVPLYDFLTSPQGGGGLVLDNVKNAVLRDYVVATGSDGYRAVFSVGGVHPGFGDREALLAYQFNGGPLGEDGFARVTAPGDLAGGRYVSNLAELQVFSATPASKITGTGGGTSSQFSLSGLVTDPGSYDLASLQALPSDQETVTYQAGKSTVTSTFTGVPLWALLESAGLVTDPNVKNDLLGKYLVATGSDGYKAVIALGEIAPHFGNHNYLVAYSVDGQGLGDDGFARLVLPGDVHGVRYVSNLIGLEVFNAPKSASVSAPGTGVLLLSAFPVLMLLRFSRRKHAAV